jgi:hypothetical protein
MSSERVIFFFLLRPYLNVLRVKVEESSKELF